MSLVPVEKSSPVVPKINELLTGAIRSLEAPGVQGGPHYRSITDRMSSAREFATQAVTPLGTEPIYPASNARQALKFADEGVGLLDQGLNPPANAKFDPVPFMRGAADNFRSSMGVLNSYSI